VKHGALLRGYATGSYSESNEYNLLSPTTFFLTYMLILFFRLDIRVCLTSHSGFATEVFYALVTTTVRAELLTHPLVLVLSLQ
jgi:hypothetical protein